MSAAPDPTADFTAAIRLYQNRQYADADRLLDRLSLPLQGEPEFHRLRGLVAADTGDGARALGHFETAVRLAPREAKHRFNLAEQARLLGRRAQAIEQIEAGLVLDPPAFGPRLTRAMLLHETGRVNDARAAFGEARQMADRSPDALRPLAVAIERGGDLAGAIEAYRRVLALVPGDFEARAHLRRIHNNLVPSWHFPMMNDGARNDAYERAITRAVTADTHVLEIGAGSGLLAMMAARAGARSVTTCEMVAPIADAAREIIARNGLADRVRLVAKPSQHLVVGVDLPVRADLLVSEIVSSSLLAEGVLDAVAHARGNLLQPGAAMIPRAVGTVGMLVGGPELETHVTVGRVSGFDLSPFNRFAPSQLFMQVESRAFARLSGPAELFRFDLAQDVPPGEERVFRFAATVAGRCTGVLQWLRLELFADIVFENQPADRIEPSGWRHSLFTFDDVIDVAPGDVVRVRARHNRISLALAFDGLERPT